MRVGPQYPPGQSTGVSAPVYQELKTTLQDALLSHLDLEKLTSIEDSKARQYVQDVIQLLIVKLNTPLSAAERERLSREVLHEIFGLGPLEPLLQDATVNHILVDTYRKVYVERGGVLEKTSVVFKDEAHLSHIIDKILSTVGRRVEGSSPMCNARLPDGSLVNVIIPPRSVDGAILSIRRPGNTPIASELEESKRLSREVLDEAFRVSKNPPYAGLNARVMDYAQVLAHAVDTFGSRPNANAWLNKPNRVFHNQSPLQILTEDPAAVEEELVRIDHGMFI